MKDIYKEIHPQPREKITIAETRDGLCVCLKCAMPFRDKAEAVSHVRNEHHQEPYIIPENNH